MPSASDRSRSSTHRKCPASRGIFFWAQGAGLVTGFERALVAIAWLAAVLLFWPATAAAERERVLDQVALPHHYYYREMYLPQLTSGPSALAWSPDGARLVYSMGGSLWIQAVGSPSARQVTAGPGYDYQPDWSPDGKRIVFARYHRDAVELQLLELESGEVRPLTGGGHVNVEPRWSPDGQRLAWVSTRAGGRFKVFVGTVRDGQLDGAALLPERQSAVLRYYYSAWDHELSPSWSPDGRELVYVANPEVAYGTGNLYRRGLGPDDRPVLVRAEETTWKARPDLSPDGRRVIWSSYAGRQWHQLWITTAAGGGAPLPLSYGDYDVTGARWSPEGRRIAYLANERGDNEIRIQEVVGGRVTTLHPEVREYLRPTGQLVLRLRDVDGAAAAGRVAVVASDGRSHAPDNAWMHGDDFFDRAHGPFETHYFHVDGDAVLALPAGAAEVTAWRGLEHAVERRTVTVEAGASTALTLQPQPLDLPAGWSQRWVSGDVHVHMNYGGTYRNTPSRQLRQAAAEDLDLVFNLVVNKEQRIPDIGYFSTAPDAASNDRALLLHGQEFHTGYWGHLGLLGLREHFLLPDYSAYPNTGLASPFPDNATVADLARAQGALVGYVHPYDRAPDPAADPQLSNALPIDVALGKVDYYEVSGFSNYRETREVWYRLLNCGFRVAAAGGTDAMANYASLRGPVGLNRAYVRIAEAGAEPAARRDAWLAGLKAGRSFATNGPLLGFSVDGREPGAVVRLPAGGGDLRWDGLLRSIVAVDHLEVVFNGEVVQTVDLDGARDAADFGGSLRVDRSGWVLLRAWSEKPSPLVFDRWPYATTTPVYIEVEGRPPRCGEDAEYFLAWIDRVQAHTAQHADYNDEAERETVLAHIAAARKVFEQRR